MNNYNFYDPRSGFSGGLICSVILTGIGFLLAAILGGS